MATATMTPTQGEPVRESGGAPRSRRNAGAGRSKRTKAEDAGSTRFFLAKVGPNGIPTLDREMASENEARIEALKIGGTYLTLDEWRPAVDLSKGAPVIGREAVRRDAKVFHNDRAAS